MLAFFTLALKLNLITRAEIGLDAVLAFCPSKPPAHCFENKGGPRKKIDINI